MTKEYGAIKLWWLLIPMGIGILGLFFGSFFDFQISESIASTTSFLGMFSEAFGEIFGYMCGPIAEGILFVGLHKYEKTIYKILSWILVLAGIGVPSYYYGRASSNDIYSFGMNKVLAYSLALLIMLLTFILTCLAVKNCDRQTLVKVGASIAMTLTICLLFQTIIKVFVGRPRYRFLISEAGAGYTFKEWWQWNWLKDGKPTDYFKSFPSGHTTTSSVTYSLVGICLLIKHKKKNLNVVMFTFFVLYSLFIAFCRVRGGAHFLSDVSMGLILGSCVNMIVRYFVFNIGPARSLLPL